MRSAVVTIVSGRHDHLRAQRRGLARSTVLIERHVVVSMGDSAIGGVVSDGLPIPTTVVHLPIDPAGLPLAAARNLGVRSAGDVDLLVLLDVDCIPDPHLIERYARAARQQPDAILGGPVTYLPPTDGRSWTSEQLTAARAPHPARPDPAVDELLPADPALFWSLSFALRPATWDRVGGFYEGYVGYGAEDTDFAQAALAAGVPIMWVGGADAFHQHHGTGAGPADHVDDIVRNGSIYAQRHGAWPMGGWLADLRRDGFVDPTPSGGWLRRDAVRVASVPDRHPYVDAVRPSSVRRVLPNRSVGWAPDPIWDVRWLAERVDELDVVHVHFGFDQVDEDALRQWVELLRVHRVALVVTVHDLRNPHHASPERHDRQLAILLDAATHVFTLTPGAARECAARFGCAAEVVAHPTLEQRVHPRDVVADEVLVPVKALRANVVDPVTVVDAVVAGAGSTTVRVLLHPVEHRVDDIAELRASAQKKAWTLDVRPYLTDDEVVDLVRHACVVVLPYRFGTHSGWVELCRDVGTRVVAPDCGYFDEQWADVHPYRNSESDGLDAASLAAAVRAAIRAPVLEPADRRARLAQRDLVRATHDVRYREVRATVRT